MSTHFAVRSSAFSRIERSAPDSIVRVRTAASPRALVPLCGHVGRAHAVLRLGGAEILAAVAHTFAGIVEAQIGLAVDGVEGALGGLDGFAALRWGALAAALYQHGDSP